MADLEWVPRCVKHMSQNIQISKKLQLEETSDHPLKPATPIIMDGRSNILSGSGVTTASKRGLNSTQSGNSSSSITNPLTGQSSLDGLDPLSQFAQEEIDPLTRMSVDEWDYALNETSNGKKLNESAESSIKPWSARRTSILNKYTTSEKLSIVTSFLPGGEKVSIKVQPSGTGVDKAKTRLDQLDELEDGSVRQMIDLTQQEYMARIEQLNNELVQAWHADHRVKALKIAIQCAKLLVDSSVMAFYPSKYVLITDTLDIFGKLVYERLKVKAENSKAGRKSITSLSDHYPTSIVSENAKETCKNWFYKIASIRELVPRLYMEMAIIKCSCFLETDDSSAALLRLTEMIRGIGDPLVAVYARSYLCRVGLSLNKTTDVEFVKKNFYDFLFTYQELFSQSIRMEINKQNMSLYSYLNLYIPACDWILQVFSATASEQQLSEILDQCKKQANSGLLINTVLSSYSPMYIASRSTEFVALINDCKDQGFPRYVLYCSLGKCLIKESPPKADCQFILESVHSYMSSLEESDGFMNCMDIWIQFTAIHFSVTELNWLLRLIIDHLNQSRKFENFYPQLQSIAEKIVVCSRDFETLTTMVNLLPFINLFQKASCKVQVCKTIVKDIDKKQGPITDPIMINALMFMTRIMHDSVSPFTGDDEKKQIGYLICQFIQRIDYARDFEKQLDFYAQARAAFHNLDAVHIQLVQCANRLSVDTRNIVRGHHTRKTSAFVRACAAFCFITIPSLTSVYSRLQLYLLSGQVALLNQCYGQADACFKAALSLVPEMPKMIDVDGRMKTSDSYLLSYLANFLSTLLVVPDSPEHGVLYLTRGLLNSVQRCADESTVSKALIYLRVLDLLSTVVQETYPYHIDKIDSNDKLYGSDQKFVDEVNNMGAKVIKELLHQLKHLGSSNQSEKQAFLSWEIFLRMIMRADLDRTSLLHIVGNLWNLSSQNFNDVDPKFRTRTWEYLMRNNESPEYTNLCKMLSKMAS